MVYSEPLCPSVTKRFGSSPRMVRMVCDAGAHIGIGIETGIDIVACSPAPGMP